MIGLGILTFVLCALVGLAARYLAGNERIGYRWNRTLRHRPKVTWQEYVIVSLIVCPVITVLVVGAGWNLAKKNLATYHEYWNGWELSTSVAEVICTRDGPCVHEYNCDPYTVRESYSCNCDDDGCDTCYRNVTKYHDCPYATAEYNYYIDTTLGVYHVGRYHFADNPIPWRARGIPGNVPRGAPEIWNQAKERIESGAPGPVTKRMDYDNLILASDNTLLKEWSGDIDSMLSGNWLPEPRRDVHAFYYADKVSFVNYTPGNPIEWQDRLNYLNAALGSELQGDLHLVIVHGFDGSPDTYIHALKAYWQDPGRFGRDAVSKNAIIVAVGTDDGETVAWARAETGMPLGNDGLIVKIRSGMKGVELSPLAILGDAHGEFYIKQYDDGSEKVKIRSVQDGGILSSLIWENFIRISMSGDDTDDVGLGFGDLWYEIEPTAWQKFLIVFLALGLCCGAWAFVAQN